MGQVLDAVILGAQCDLAVVTFHPGELDSPAATQEAHAPEQDSATLNLKRIMVPTAGGPHAPLAIRIGLSLAKESDAGVSAVYVADPEATPAQLKSGQLRIQNTIDAIHKEADKLHALQQDRAHYEAIPIDSMVIRADDISEGIARAGEEFDLVLLGASEERLIDQALFGTIPEQVARNCSTPTIMVKHFRGLTRFWIQKIWNSVARILPALDSRERINVYKDLRRGARPDIDYFIMMGLSAIIATFGLLQNSSAVIIGAMLVAPLFTPILAFSLAIAQGETRLMRIAAEAAIKGITLALGLATIITAFAPMDILISEIMARAQPNMFDLFIALASGAAGAYAVARKDVAASLPGVAIAAALVPPISVIGIGLAKGDLAVASGAMLLFVTNLVAITLAGTITLLLLGFRPARRGPGDTNLYVGVLSSIIMLALIMVPLISLSNQALTRYTTRLNIEKALTMSIASTPEIMLADYDIDITEQHAELEVSLYTEGSPGQDFADKLRQTLEDAAGMPVSIQIHAIPVNTIESLQTASGTDG